MRTRLRSPSTQRPRSRGSVLPATACAPAPQRGSPLRAPSAHGRDVSRPTSRTARRSLGRAERGLAQRRGKCPPPSGRRPMGRQGRVGGRRRKRPSDEGTSRRRVSSSCRGTAGRTRTCPPAMAESDWDTVTVLRKKGPTAAQAKSKQAILAAQRRGEDVETSKKWAAGQNKQHSITKNTAKLDRETEELHHDRVTLEVGKVIQQGRQSKGLTQKDLATKINEKPQVIADYESGRAIPNNQVLGKIERAIGECPRVLHRVSAAARPGAEQLKHRRASEAAGFCRALGSSGVSFTIPPPRQFHIFSVPFFWLASALHAHGQKAQRPSCSGPGVLPSGIGLPPGVGVAPVRGAPRALKSGSGGDSSPLPWKVSGCKDSGLRLARTGVVHSSLLCPPLLPMEEGASAQRAVWALLPPQGGGVGAPWHCPASWVLEWPPWR
uniref:Endothelial differentiation-related factor 1 n=1 Tax=Canis lupus familiaris TaxID=9615 RepID=A0A8C0RCC5_CANLF